MEVPSLKHLPGESNELFSEQRNCWNLVFPTYVSPLLLTLHPLAVTSASPKNSLWHCNWRSTAAFSGCQWTGQCACAASPETPKWILRICTAWLSLGGVICLPLLPVSDHGFSEKLYKWNYLWDFYPSFKSAWNKPEISMSPREKWTNRWTDKELGT